MQNQNVSDNRLQVFKASAGSGKTHRLTAEYLKLLFASPLAYKHILAVTFTNKATDEMKSRIISELANLAKGENSDYLAMLSAHYGLNEQQVRQRAAERLIYILHDYASFAVSTIDRFFQQTMRAFTRELGLSGGFGVELDTDKVLNEAVDKLLFDLERNDSRLLLDWLIRFSEEKVENGETWNIRNDILALAKELFKEDYKANSNEVLADTGNKQAMHEYKKMLQDIITQYEARLQQLAEKALNLLLRYRLQPDDLKGGSRSPFKQLVKWANGDKSRPTATFLKLENNVDEWQTQKTSSDIRDKVAQAYPELNAVLVDIIAHFSDSLQYNTAVEINRYFFVLGILGDIDAKIRSYCADNNVMLISDTTELLSKIISGSDSPFIYEKIGTRVENYMIDEFQDTSSMQWANFHPLLHESLASGHKNFIVGDVKQSIYRWRNSDWKLLDEEIDREFSGEGIIHETLDQNWRSCPNIVNFNNALFAQAASILQNAFNQNLDPDSDLYTYFASKISNAYHDHYQFVPRSKKSDDGHVYLQFVEDESPQTWKQKVLADLPLQICQLQDRGFELKDIAILVRTKKEGADIAACLLDYKETHPSDRYRYDVISDEALFIANASAIKLIVSLLRYMRNPADHSLRSLAVYEYYKYQDRLTANQALEEFFSLDSDFPDTAARRIAHIAELPLYEMVEELFSMFAQAMDPQEQIYIQAFMDMVLDFSVRNIPDLDAFLTWWDKSGVNKTVSTSAEQDAIKIMTIHKSKGLGFKAVIIPFCAWEIDHKQPVTLWCKPAVEPFDRISLVPLKYSARLKDTIFRNQYYTERLHAFIDNLNLLYVAFTRCKDELIVFSPRPQKQDTLSVAGLLQQAVQDFSRIESSEKFYMTLSDSFDVEQGIFQLGHDSTKKLQPRNHTHPDEIMIGYLPGISFDSRIQLLLKNKNYFNEKGIRDFGSLMHEIVSSIETTADLEYALQTYYLSGDLTLEQKRNVSELLMDYLSQPQVSEWYSGKYTVLNEVDILEPKGKLVRPDRVMLDHRTNQVIVIDYKFGEKESPKYVRQVAHYKKRIAEMGYTVVKGFICYISLRKIVEV